MNGPYLCHAILLGANPVHFGATFLMFLQSIRPFLRSTKLPERDGKVIIKIEIKNIANCKG